MNVLDKVREFVNPSLIQVETVKAMKRQTNATAHPRGKDNMDKLLSSIIGMALALSVTLNAYGDVEGEHWQLHEETQTVLDFSTKDTSAYELINEESTEIDTWTPEDYKNATPLPLPQMEFRPFELESALDAADEMEINDEPAVEFEGSPPLDTIAPDLENRLYEPEESSQSNPLDTSSIEPGPTEFTPQNFGPSGAHFTSSQLVPIQSDVYYPYRTVGKLFFRDAANRPGHCSAAVIRPRIILTAAHCVFLNGRPHKDWRFVPAFRNGKAPYGVWRATSVIAPSAWVNNQTPPPHPVDFAVMELEDKIINSQAIRIGNAVGWLGVKVNALHSNHATLLGYPGNFDRGEFMHQVNSQSFRLGGLNTVLYGSDMSGGSSGGPWIENFGIPSVGQPHGSGVNRIIGVTSYGNLANATQGSSILDSRFIGILDAICSRRTGNCG